MLLVYVLCIVTQCLFSCFFFKQKTAYEMRISDWSSDVCSSDLLWLARIHPDDVDEMRERMREHLRGNTEYYDHEYRMRGDDGSYRWVHSRGLGVRDDTGRVYRMEGSLSDITERKKAEHELLRAKEAAEMANRTKGDFLDTMRHELRQPLNALIGFSMLIQQKVLGPIGHDNYRDYIQNIHESGNHLLTIDRKSTRLNSS